MPYALIPLGLTALLLYGFTFLLSRTGLLSPANHKKIWNTALLLTFLATAILGIILAIQVNYKLELPLVDRLIVWHVDFGIGMSLIALFHFSWHWSYYRKLIMKERSANSIQKKTETGKDFDKEQPVHDFSLKNIPSGEKIPLLTLGATAMITQVIFLREYLALFHGNELVIGIILSVWLLLTGTGALIGRNIPASKLREQFTSNIPASKLREQFTSNIPASKLRERFTSTAFIFLGLLPIISIAGIRFFKNLLFPAGSIAGIPGILLYSTIGMFIFCLLSGFLFTWLGSRMSKLYRANLVPYSYALESAGSIVAGILFSFLFVHFLSTFQILFILLLLNLITAILSSPASKRRSVWFISFLLMFTAFILVFPLKLERVSRSFLFPNQELIETRDTPYGNLVVTETSGQFTLFENSVPVSVSTEFSNNVNCPLVYII